VLIGNYGINVNTQPIMLRSNHLVYYEYKVTTPYRTHLHKFTSGKLDECELESSPTHVYNLHNMIGT